MRTKWLEAARGTLGVKPVQQSQTASLFRGLTLMRAQTHLQQVGSSCRSAGRSSSHVVINRHENGTRNGRVAHCKPKQYSF